MRYLFCLVFCSLSLVTISQPVKSTNTLKKDSIKSSMDGGVQQIYYFKSTDQNPKPLIVQLHSWSFPADSLRTGQLDVEVTSKNFNYIFPNFRGVNDRLDACCSKYVISDIDEAIDWAIKYMNVDKSKIYIVGVSGGGYATLAMYMKSRHNIKAFSAWVPISDLENWYLESVERKNRYASDIIKCTSETDSFDVMKARERSPFYWTTPVKERRRSILQIFAGIHDGHNGPVPISHSIVFYNKLLRDNGVSDSSAYVSRKDLSEMINEQKFAGSTPLTIGDRAIHYQKKTKHLMLTIFEGGHEMLSKEVLGYIDRMNGRR
jgi:predicted peptidase